MSREYILFTGVIQPVLVVSPSPLLHQPPILSLQLPDQPHQGPVLIPQVRQLLNLWSADEGVDVMDVVSRPRGELVNPVAQAGRLHANVDRHGVCSLNRSVTFARWNARRTVWHSMQTNSKYSFRLNTSRSWARRAA